LSGKTLCIVGLGLIGGSLAASLKARRMPWRVRATDRRRSALKTALRRGIVDEVVGGAVEAVSAADIVVLAAPVADIKRLVETLGPELSPGQVLTDVGSTKASIVAQAEKSLSRGAAFVGGHPIAGSEHSGVENAIAGLFEGKICVLTPTDNTPREALGSVAALWKGLGAEVQIVPPAVHDALLGRLSHLPNLVAYALLRTVASSLSPADLRLAGGALQDYTRVARSPLGIWRDVCLENREAIGKAMEEFQAQIEELRAAVVRGDGSAIEEFLKDAAEARGHVWPD
jgi:prephenate dehydrogenase